MTIIVVILVFIFIVLLYNKAKQSQESSMYQSELNGRGKSQTLIDDSNLEKSLPEKRTSHAARKAYQSLSEYDLEAKRIDRENLFPNEDASDNLFKGIKVVFTGNLDSISRNEASAALSNLGADVNMVISSKTNLVVLGQNAGPKKLERLYDLINKGYPIKVIEEADFLLLLKEAEEQAIDFE